MQSKKLCFNKTLIRHNLGQYWPVWAAYAVIWFFLLPLPLLNNLRSPWSDPYYMTTRGILDLALYGGTIMSAIFGGLAAMAGFGYLYNPKSSGFMSSLPIKRGDLFLTQFFTWLGVLLGVNVLLFLATLGAEAVHGYVNLPFLLQWLAINSMLNILFYGFAVFCAMLTGSLLVLPVLYTVLNFTVYVLENIVRIILTNVVYGLSNVSTSLEFLSPIVRLLTGGQLISSTFSETNASALPVHQFTGYPLLLSYLAAGLIFAALAFLLYRRRAMESATDVVAVKALRPLFKYCFTFGCSLVIGYLLYNLLFGRGFNYSGLGAGPTLSLVGLAAMLVFGGFVGYFAACMLLNKTFTVFKGNWRGFLVSAAVILALLTACELDLFGYERRVPDSADVVSVYVSTSGWNTDIRDPANIEAFTDLHRSIVANKSIHESLYENKDFDTRGFSLRVNYELTDGSFLSRRYSIVYIPDSTGPESADAYRLNALFNTREAVTQRKEMSIPVTQSSISYAYINYFDRETMSYNGLDLSPKEAYELYTSCIVPDVDAGRIGLVWLVSDSDYKARCYDLRISIEVSRRLPDGRYEYDQIDTSLTTASLLTEAWIRDRGVDPVTIGEAEALGQYGYKEYAYPAGARVYG